MSKTSRDVVEGRGRAQTPRFRVIKQAEFNWLHGASVGEREFIPGMLVLRRRGEAALWEGHGTNSRQQENVSPCPVQGD